MNVYTCGFKQKHTAVAYFDCLYKLPLINLRWTALALYTVSITEITFVYIQEYPLTQAMCRGSKLAVRPKPMICICNIYHTSFSPKVSSYNR